MALLTIDPILVSIGLPALATGALLGALIAWLDAPATGGSSCTGRLKICNDGSRIRTTCSTSATLPLRRRQAV
ncbi:MAG: hypothetical protein U5K38_19275 [Woeseiaceae bacterium]|nr:hypothetical protein [Woeseiaceae bacterium]